MIDKIGFECEESWDIISPETNRKLAEYTRMELGRDITAEDIEDYRVTVKIELSLFDK